VINRKLTAVFLVVFVAASVCRADAPATTQPFSGVTYVHEQQADPPENIFVVKIDLTNPKVTVRVAPGGPDPDGDGPWQTTLLPVREIAEREHFDIAVNASFFDAKNTKDAEGAQSGYVRDKWSSAVGWAMTDGKLWSPVRWKSNPVLWIAGDRSVHIGSPENVPSDAKQIVQGNGLVVENGKPTEPAGNLKVRHPRTVVGIDKDGKTLVLLTVDGRNPSKSLGMTGPELAAEMIKQGCWTAINLDGGGSSTLVMRDPSSDQLKVINDPSDHRERAVADVVGVTIRGADSKKP
jgi:exopolysaccharide biosynthesis protein